jgi:hypothetical protein
MAKGDKQRAYRPNPHEDFGPAVVGGRSLKRRIEAGELVVCDAAQTEGGIVTARAVRRVDACLVDALHERRMLDRDGDGRMDTQAAKDEGARRHEAGVWLRTLYIEKAGLTPGMSYRFDACGGMGELTDDMAWNRKCFNDTMRALPKYGELLTNAICHDDAASALQDMGRLCVALTALADHRGM